MASCDDVRGICVICGNEVEKGKAGAVQVEDGSWVCGIRCSYKYGAKLRKMGKSTRPPLKAVLVVMGIFILIGVIAGTAISMITNTESSPDIPKDTIDWCIWAIEEENQVIDAAIVQGGGTVSMAIIVQYDTTQIHAKFLGQKFVNLLADRYTDDYDYIIGIYFPDETLVVDGIRSSSSSTVRW